MTSNDLQRLFRHMPGRFLVLRPDADFTIVCASADYLATAHRDERIFGRPLFEVFPDNPALPEAAGVRLLTESLRRVIATQAPDAMPPLRYDLPLPDTEGGGFQQRHWQLVNSPVLGEADQVEYLIHRVEDATARANQEAVDILENITEGFYTVDRQWRFGYVNREAYRILGREQSELPGEVTTLPAPEGISAYFRDVTGQRRVLAERERLVAESETQRRICETALDSTPDFVYVFDLEHIRRILSATQAEATSRLGAKTVFTAHLASVLKTMALDGRGIAWLPQSLVTDDLANGQLAAAGGDAWQVALDIRLYRTPASLGTAAQAFWQAARVSSPIGR